MFGHMHRMCERTHFLQTCDLFMCSFSGISRVEMVSLVFGTHSLTLRPHSHSVRTGSIIETKLKCAELINLRDGQKVVVTADKVNLISVL